MASKRKSLFIDEKVSIIHAIGKGEKKSDVAKRYGHSISTVFTIFKNKEKILQAAMEGNSSKKLKKPKFENLDQVMLSWVCKQGQSKIHISGPIIKSKAEKVAEELGIMDFKASEGWLQKFKRRHRIKFDKEYVETQEINTEANVWIKKEWPESKEDYANEIILGNTDKPIGQSAVDEGHLSLVRKIKEEDSEENKLDAFEPPPTIEQAMLAAKILEKFFSEHDPTVLQHLNKIKQKIVTI